MNSWQFENKQNFNGNNQRCGKSSGEVNSAQRIAEMCFDGCWKSHSVLDHEDFMSFIVFVFLGGGDCGAKEVYSI